MKRCFALAFLFAGLLAAGRARAIGPEIGPYRPIGGPGGGNISSIVNSDGYLVIGSPTGPATDITLGPQVVLQDSDFLGGAGTSWDFRFVQNFYPSSSSVCNPTTSASCFDTNGIAEMSGVALVFNQVGTNRLFPSWTTPQLGTAGTKRALGIGAGNAPETTVVAATPTANALPLADGSGKLADGWLSSLVSLLGQTIEIGEIAAGDKSGNGADLATTAGAQTSGDCVEIDANGNHVASGAPCGGSLPAQASAPSNPSAGTFLPWLNTVDDQVRAIKSDGTQLPLARRKGSATTTGHIPFWDGAQYDESAWSYEPGSGSIVGPGVRSTENTTNDTNGITFPTNNVSGGTRQTCASADWHGQGTSAGTNRISIGDLGAGPSTTYTEICANNAPGPIPHTLPFSSSNYGSIGANRMMNWWMGTASSQNPEAADQAYLLWPISPDNDFRLRRLLWHFNANSGWASTEQVYLDIVTCTLPTSGADIVIATDCTTLHSIVIQNAASATTDTPTTTYRICQTDSCQINIVFDDTDTVSAPVGTAKRDAFMLFWNNSDGRFTADGGTALVSYTSGVVEGWW